MAAWYTRYRVDPDLIADSMLTASLEHMATDLPSLWVLEARHGLAVMRNVFEMGYHYIHVYNVGVSFS